MTDVTDADRLRAAGYYQTKRGCRNLAQNIKEGYVDDDPIVIMLAKHREAAMRGH